MMLRLTFAALTLAVLALLLWPLLRRQSAVAPHGDFDVAVYRDQLAEIDKDLERRLLSPAQAEAARTEIQRRMLAAADAAETAASLAQGDNSRRQWLMALVLAAALPLGAGLMYVRLGAPALPAKPYAARQQDPEIMMAAAMGRLVEQLDHKPDAEGYRHLATLGFMLRRYDQAAEAYRKLIALQGADAALWSKLGEALVLANEGQVVPEAREAFAETLRRDPQEARARFYTGLAAAQDAAPDRALALWRELERDSPADSPWLPMLKAHIALYASVLRRSREIDSPLAAWP